jgi:hypothetical protein
LLCNFPSVGITGGTDRLQELVKDKVKKTRDKIITEAADSAKKKELRDQLKEELKKISTPESKYRRSTARHFLEGKRLLPLEYVDNPRA